MVLVSGRPLESRHRDHALIGPWQGSRDCHFKPDRLLIYRLESDSLFLERTGSRNEPLIKDPHPRCFKNYVNVWD